MTTILAADDRQAHARRSDPQTSQEAAVRVSNTVALRTLTLALLRQRPMTDEDIFMALRALGVMVTPSGARSRRKELSGPNDERLKAIADEMRTTNPHALPDVVAAAARHQLRIEGFRSPVWDSGERRLLDSGRRAVVWAIAE